VTSETATATRIMLQELVGDTPEHEHRHQQGEGTLPEHAA
jgi:hypothetical protein